MHQLKWFYALLFEPWENEKILQTRLESCDAGKSFFFLKNWELSKLEPFQSQRTVQMLMNREDLKICAKYNQTTWDIIRWFLVF
jgi:hypothetical protein